MGAQQTANRAAIRFELNDWRETISQEAVQELCHKTNNKFTVGVLSSGVGVDTLASVRAGFRPIWCTEIDKDASEVWKRIYGGECLGDTFKTDWRTVKRVVYLTSGQPCPDYSRAGLKLGQYGQTGWMFTAQVDVILEIRPVCFRLEISDYAWQINEGEEVKEVLNRLAAHYFVKHKILNVYGYGDGSYRRRLFIVGFDRQLGEAGQWFEWPVPQFGEHYWHCARDFAVDDQEVPKEYWRYDEPRRVEWHAAEAGKLQKLASAGEGMGHASCPNNVYSWDGTFNSQTAANGGARRPRLDWKQSRHGDIGPTRLTTPVECARVASLPNWFRLEMEKQNADPAFTFRGINNGIPCRTATAVDTQVMAVLIAAQFLMDTKSVLQSNITSQSNHTKAKYTAGQVQCMVARASQESRYDAFRVATWQNSKDLHLAKTFWRRFLLDTGANLTLMHTDAKRQLKDARRSTVRVQAANSGVTKGQLDGRIEATTHGAKLNEKVTTMSNIPQELLSVDNKYYKERFSVLITQPEFTVKCDHCGAHTGIGEPRIAKIDNGAEVSIPIETDERYGGFWVNYKLQDDEHEDDYDLKHCYIAAAQAAAHEAVTAITTGGDYEALYVQGYDGDWDDTAPEQWLNDGMERALNAQIVEEFLGNEQEPCNIRGVKSGLKSHKQRMNITLFHEDHSHLGFEQQRYCTK